MTSIFETIEKDAVMVWDDFLKGITYLTAEANILMKWVEGQDPAIHAQVQSWLKDAETAAAALAAHEGTALHNIVASGTDLAEQRAANLIQSATGNSPLGVTGSALAAAGIGLLGNIVQDMTTVGYTKALAGLAQAAGVIHPSPTQPAPAPSAEPGQAAQP